MRLSMENTGSCLPHQTILNNVTGWVTIPSLTPAIKPAESGQRWWSSIPYRLFPTYECWLSFSPFLTKGPFRVIHFRPHSLSYEIGLAGLLGKASEWMRLQSQTPPEVNPLVRCWNLRSRLTVVRTCSVSAPDFIAFVSADPMKSALSRRWPYVMTVSFLNSRSQLVHPKDTLMHPQHDKKKKFSTSEYCLK